MSRSWMPSSMLKVIFNCLEQCPSPQALLFPLSMAAMTCLLRRRFHYGMLSRFSLGTSFSTSSPTIGNRPIEKILIANRGEIACRIMRTANRLGIRTVAVYSDADKDSLHVKFADEAIRIGPPPAKLSYLNSNSIIEAARRAGAQAIHPGYGFLSENAEFAQLCENEGLTFIGPPASAIRDMGDKSASKRIMGEAAVPLVPGYHGFDQDIDLMKSEADKIGYPLIIKPTHGGGGKGMRIVQSPDEFVDSFLGAQREAAASFKVDTILLEKYITRPRHIEVQIFGDKHGNVLYLYERDCSLQRRHQKIIEEAPAPHVNEDFRAQVGQAAVSAAKAVGYYNAGTVEFIMDTVSGQFYFMEMNTRLQVEHPVTEMVVGQDLVEWQIRVANGEPLPITQSEVPLSGHAFEARIYAENVSKGFLPATGVLHHYRPVPASETIRVETGVEQGGTVTMHYDPMIAKLVVWGESRSAALVKLRDCLTKFQVAGVPTNISFLHQLAIHQAFEKGEVETHFIEQFKDDLFPDPNDATRTKEQHEAAELSAIVVSACLSKKEHYGYQQVGSPLSIWYSDTPFRINYCATQHLQLEWENEHGSKSSTAMELIITYEKDGSYVIESAEDGSAGNIVKVIQLDEHDFSVDINGLSVHATLAVYSKGPIRHIHVWHGSHHHHFTQTVGLELSDEDESHHQASSGQPVAHARGSVVAPMAGLVVKVLVEDGAKVESGQPVLVLEAMKMEHVVKAPSSGLIHGLQVVPGQQVSDGSVLFKVKECV